MRCGSFGRYNIKTSDKDRSRRVVHNQSGHRISRLRAPLKIRADYLERLEVGDPIPRVLRKEIGCLAIPLTSCIDFKLGLEILGDLDAPKRRGRDYSQQCIPAHILTDEIRRLWPEEHVRGFLAGRSVSLPSIGALRRSKFYQAFFNKTRGGLKQFLQGMGEPYSDGLYFAVHRGGTYFYEDIDEDELGRSLFSRFLEGKCVSWGALSCSTFDEERDLAGQIAAVARHYRVSDVSAACLLIRKNQDRFWKGKDIRKEVEISRTASKQNSILGERFVEFLLSWGYLTGTLSKFMERTGLCEEDFVFNTSRGGSARFRYNGDQYEADLRIGNRAIEVKTFHRIFGSRDTKRLLLRYDQRRNAPKWEDGEQLEFPSVVFFNSVSDCYSKSRREIEDHGLVVITFEETQELLKKVLTTMQKDFSDSFYQTCPRVYTPDNLATTFEEVSTHPYLILRSCYENQRLLVISQLESLIKQAHAIQNG